ncbi:MAG: hypothetical protein JXR22_04225 [Prolixibacteraceae bacterium]|nr:hypothetical protein [Prolixibacteraceae bacterium]
MKKSPRYLVFILGSILFYMLWISGGEKVYAKLISTGISKITASVSAIDKVEYKHFEKENKTMLFLQYPDKSNKIALEYCLPVVLLLAWQFSLFVDRKIKKKTALGFLAFNFTILYFLQIFFPLLLYNISESKARSMGLFVGLQIFGFIVFFLIIKDSLLIKYKKKFETEEPST